jgi:hypothetical protein
MMMMMMMMMTQNRSVFSPLIFRTSIEFQKNSTQIIQVYKQLWTRVKLRNLLKRLLLAPGVQVLTLFEKFWLGSRIVFDVSTAANLSNRFKLGERCMRNLG